jgi:hypothetical protein
MPVKSSANMRRNIMLKLSIKVGKKLIPLTLYGRTAEEDPTTEIE